MDRDTIAFNASAFVAALVLLHASTARFKIHAALIAPISLPTAGAQWAEVRTAAVAWPRSRI
jgi:hypothetical protein